MDRFAVFSPPLPSSLSSHLDNTSSSPNTHASSLRSSVRVFPAGTPSDHTREAGSRTSIERTDIQKRRGQQNDPSGRTNGRDYDILYYYVL